MAEPSTTTPCVVCGRVPTRTESIRRHEGMLVLRRSSAINQPLCRDHGVAIARNYLRRTLIEGWWGFIVFFANLVAVPADLRALVRYRALGEPEPLR